MDRMTLSHRLWITNRHLEVNEISRSHGWLESWYTTCHLPPAYTSSRMDVLSNAGGEDTSYQSLVHMAMWTCRDWFPKDVSHWHGINRSTFIWMLRLSRSPCQFETQDIKTQPQFNHYLRNHLAESSWVYGLNAYASMRHSIQSVQETGRYLSVHESVQFLQHKELVNRSWISPCTVAPQKTKRPTFWWLRVRDMSLLVLIGIEPPGMSLTAWWLDWAVPTS